VTDRSSTEPSQPSPDAVRRSLRALADGSVPGRHNVPPEVGPDDATASPPRASTDTTASPPEAGIDTASAPPPASVVREAEQAAGDARVAAAFLSAERLPHLDAAVATAVARGDDELAERGRVARTSLQRLDSVLNARVG
jgi:hypothetical protein